MFHRFKFITSNGAVISTNKFCQITTASAQFQYVRVQIRECLRNLILDFSAVPFSPASSGYKPKAAKDFSALQQIYIIGLAFGYH